MLLQGTGIEVAWGDRVVLRGADLTVHAGQRIGLVGPNGCGKSTLLSVLAGRQEADHGQVVRRAPVGWLGQAPLEDGGTVGEVAASALAWHRDLVAAWEAALAAGDTAEVAALQARLDVVGWDLSHQVAATLDRLRAPPMDAPIARLSGGERRRVALAHALLASPDLLLLDEPTNHLDAETTEWLEGFLQSFRGGVVIVTHDRYLLEAVATQVVEVEDGVTVAYDGSWADYLVARAERQAALQKAEDARLNLLAREAAWAAKSPAARTTKQKARLDRLEALRDVRGLPVEQRFSLDLRTGVKLGRVLVEARGLSKAWGARQLFAGVDLDVAPGDRIGIVGANGAGKSTLLSILSGATSADRGELRRAPRVQVAVLDQERTGLNLDDTVFEAAGDGNTWVTPGDEPVHVAGFLRRFLFSREALDQKVGALSGGERARLLMARLLLHGCQLLMLDEPTNDLDLMTLSVLEEALLGFDGAAIVVTHDRAFLDRVCTAILAIHDDGRVVRYASRQQWLAALAGEKKAVAVAESKAAPPAPRRERVGARLSFKEKQELDALPQRIEALEQEKAELEAAMADPASYRSGAGADLGARHAALEEAVLTAYARWEELEARA